MSVSGGSTSLPKYPIQINNVILELLIPALFFRGRLLYNLDIVGNVSYPTIGYLLQAAKSDRVIKTVTSDLFRVKASQKSSKRLLYLKKGNLTLSTMST